MHGPGFPTPGRCTKLYRLMLLAPTPGGHSSDPPGRHWDPTNGPHVNITPNQLKFIGVLVVILVICGLIARMNNSE